MERRVAVRVRGVQAWSGGPAASSVGVEFKGTFDFSYFDDGDLTTLDYCAANSDGATTVSQSGRAGRR